MGVAGAGLIPLLAALAHAGPVEVRVPIPTQRLYDARDRVCVNAPARAPVPPIEVDDGRFSVSCTSDAGKAQLCLTLLLDQWPERVGTFECGVDPVYRLVPVPAFDPAETVWDGVQIRRDVSVLQAAYRVPDIEYAAGILPVGSCGITDHRFWFRAPAGTGAQTCTLVIDEQTERAVRIKPVRRLRPPG